MSEENQENFYITSQSSYPVDPAIVTLTTHISSTCQSCGKTKIIYGKNKEDLCSCDSNFTQFFPEMSEEVSEFFYHMVNSLVDKFKKELRLGMSKYSPDSDAYKAIKEILEKLSV